MKNSSEIESDLYVERDRYDLRASEFIRLGEKHTRECLGLKVVHALHQAPFVEYYEMISKNVHPGNRVLELACGQGQHTQPLISTSAFVTALDISEVSLRVLDSIFNSEKKQVETVLANMEDVPLPSESYDRIVICGGLSYGDFTKLFFEIKRLLRPGGRVILLDSLNHNPIYRANRYRHYLRGRRSRSTLKRMPNLKTINSLAEDFDLIYFRTFGTLNFLFPLLKLLIGRRNSLRILSKVDDRMRKSRFAFKFLLMLEKK
jgi:ubiquinone/menaquinone biosynthesis C-methylase UbiE